jgi:hypothetical protein
MKRAIITIAALSLVGCGQSPASPSFVDMGENSFIRDQFRNEYNTTFQSRGLDWITVECVSPVSTPELATKPYLFINYKYFDSKQQTIKQTIDTCQNGPLFKVERFCSRYCAGAPYSVFSFRPFTFNAIKPVIDTVLNDPQNDHL